MVQRGVARYPFSDPPMQGVDKPEVPHARFAISCRWHQTAARKPRSEQRRWCTYRLRGEGWYDGESVSWRSKIDKAIRQAREALRSLTPVEAVEIFVLLLWAIFVLVYFKACG